MRTRCQNHPTTQVIIGLFVISIGLLFLLDNLGWVDLDLRLHIWPTAMIFFGILKLMQTRTRSGMVVGGALIGIGGLILLKETGLISVSWRTLWPVLLIGVGLVVVFKSTKGRQTAEKYAGPMDKPSGDEAFVNVTAIMGGYKNRIITPDFRGGEITAVMGGADLDLRQSSLSGDAVIDVFSLFGGITIRVPIDWTVQLEGTPIMGGFEEKTVPPAVPGKRLIVRGYIIMGGLEVRN